VLQLSGQIILPSSDSKHVLPSTLWLRLKHNRTPLAPSKQCRGTTYDTCSLMATLAAPSPPRSPSRMPRRWARKCERYCCIGITYFPLVFVYSITTWAVWVEATIGFMPSKSAFIGKPGKRVRISVKLTYPRQGNLDVRDWSLYPSKLVIYYSCLYESWIDDGKPRWL
jgi:hypothetical protein